MWLVPQHLTLCSHQNSFWQSASVRDVFCGVFCLSVPVWHLFLRRWWRREELLRCTRGRSPSRGCHSLPPCLTPDVFSCTASLEGGALLQASWTPSRWAPPTGPPACARCWQPWPGTSWGECWRIGQRRTGGEGENEWGGYLHAPGTSQAGWPAAAWAHCAQPRANRGAYCEPACLTHKDSGVCIRTSCAA